MSVSSAYFYNLQFVLITLNCIFMFYFNFSDCLSVNSNFVAVFSIILKNSDIIVIVGFNWSLLARFCDKWQFY